MLFRSSRAPVDEPEEEIDSTEKGALIYEIKSENAIQNWCKSVKFVKYLNVSDKIIEEVKEATKTDESMKLLKSLIFGEWPANVKDLREDVRAFYKHKDELAWQDNLIFRGQRIVIPVLMRKKIIEKVHTAHNGIEASQKLAKENVYWPGMLQHIEDKVKMCETCAKFSASQRKQPMMSHEIPIYPFQYVSMDCFETKVQGRKKNFLITVDHYSDFFELDILDNMSPRSVIKASKNNFARHGIPQRICTDNGTNFDCREMKTFAKEWSFEHEKSAPNHQQANGKAEAAVKIAKGLVKKAEEDGKDFEFAMLHWRNTPNKMNSSPNQRLMSRNTRTSIPTAVENLKPRIVENVPETIGRRREISKKYYDKSTQQRRDLEVGENVMVQLRQGQDKSWTPGKVLEKQKDRAYDVRVNDTVYRRDELHVKPNTSTEKSKTPTMSQGAQISTPTPVEHQSTSTPVEEGETPQRKLRERALLKKPNWYNEVLP